MKRIIILLVLALIVSAPELLFGQTKDQLIGKSFNSDPKRWVSINNQYVLREVGEAFIKMQQAARRDGVELTIVSGFRSFERQKQIWDRKWNASGLRGMKDDQKLHNIMQYSSMPGTSRHHWGTDIDLNSVEPSYFETPQGKKIYRWLQKNAERYGFIQPYPAGRNKGYQEEKWHWSYAPLSDIYLKKYLVTVSNNEVLNYANCSHIKNINIIDNWVKI